MTVLIEELKPYASTLSLERLLSFKTNDNDTIDMLIQRYKINLRISQSLYPELSTLEVTLRNAIDTMLRSCISETWLEDEIGQRRLLTEHEHAKLITAYDDIKKECQGEGFSRGKVIANLNFGFWTNLCSKWYSSNIWNKNCCFKGVFINYPSNVNQIGIIASKLRAIRYLRNRIFHYEPIFKQPQNTLKMYNEIMEIISYLPTDNSNILKDTSTFIMTYNQVLSEI